MTPTITLSPLFGVQAHELCPSKTESRAGGTKAVSKISPIKGNSTVELAASRQRQHHETHLYGTTATLRA